MLPVESEEILKRIIQKRAGLTDKMDSEQIYLHIKGTESNRDNVNF